MADSKIRAKETEDSLRKEVSSLKAIIKDLEDRLGKTSPYASHLYTFAIGLDPL